MDNRSILLQTLSQLVRDLRAHQFTLMAINAKQKQLEKNRMTTEEKIDEIKRRLEYNIDKHKNLLS